MATTSATVRVEAAPTCALISPKNNAVVRSGAAVVINANALDSDGKISGVTFYDNGAALGTGIKRGYQFKFKPTKGIHLLTATASDDLGLVTTSTPITIIVK